MRISIRLIQRRGAYSRSLGFHLQAAATAVLALCWGPQSLQWAQAQTTCGSNSTVVDEEGAEYLQDIINNCTDGGNVTVKWDGAITLNSSIVISSGISLSITGVDDDAEVKGGQQTRLFQVSSGGSLSLTQMTISGGSAGKGGAIISDNGTIKLNSCVFSGNSASNAGGGAIWAENGTLTVSGGEFFDNNASSLGGAIYAVDAGFVVQQREGEGATFTGNRGVIGGAIFCGGSDNDLDTVTSTCFISGAEFSSNFAIIDGVDEDTDVSDWIKNHRGGAVAFYDTSVYIEDSEFGSNYAPIRGGAVHGGNHTDINLAGCTFRNNTTGGDGAAMSVYSVIVGGGTEIRNNSAYDGNGGGIYGWSDEGSIVLNDVSFLNNSAEDNGGCLYVSGDAVINNGTIMLNNEAELGGCVYGNGGCDIEVTGGNFTGCEAQKNGGFLFASDGAVVTITGGMITDNLASDRGAAIYCSGESFDMGGSVVSITGGTFENNVALEHGGAISIWGDTTVVTVKGGTFINNSAKYYGGFIFLEEMASMSCTGATLLDNYAGDQGGSIYARGAEWVNITCDLIGNESPQGAAAYLTHIAESATIENVTITDNIASGGSVLYVAQSSVVLTSVTFESSIDLEDDSSNRAVQMDSGSTLVGDGCTFTGWLGDTVIHNSNADDASLELNSCDFRGSSAVMAVVSPYSDAVIRNAIVGESTLENAEFVNGSAVLVDRALNCTDANTCDSSGECVDSDLGVLCECLDDDTPCLVDGGTLSLTLETAPDDVTYSPDLVSFELMVSAAADGTTSVIWDLSYEADDLDLEVIPSSGVLPPGDTMTVTVTGTNSKDDVGGNLTSTFTLPPVGSASTSTSGTTTSIPTLEVQSAFYLCYAYQYDDPDNDEDDRCQQCDEIEGSDGVDCDEPGATKALLPIESGYWRSSNESLVVLECIYSEACAGATQVSSSDDYCEEGYKGPYCALCDSGYGRSVGNICYSCEDTRSRYLIVAGALFFLVIFLSLALAVIFLIGGLDAVGSVTRSAANTLSIGAKTPRVPWSSTPGVTFPHFKSNEVANRPETTNETLARSFAYKTDPELSVEMRRHIDSTNGKAALAVMPETVSPSSVATHGAKTSLLIEEEDNRGASGRPGCCDFRERMKRWWSRVPLDKLKILVVVWQILTVFPSITAVDFPPVYSRFLSIIDIFNLDLVRFFSASCVFPGVNFYERLLVTTLTPIVLCGMMAVTYHMAKRRAGIGSMGVIARRAAWSRHMAAGLLLSFLVFTSASTVVFKTFGCDGTAIEGESYLRADYSLSCRTTTHTIYKVYAGFMLLVYPIGIPLMYAFILWKNRHLLNPTLAAATRAEEERKAEMSQVSDQEAGGVDERNNGVQGGKKRLSPEEEEELEKMVELRRTNPELVPSMFLWKDFGPDLYYYEVIECGRRILLTGVLIFIDPYTSTQAAAACIFAFASLLGFELLRPHLDPIDSWLYRLGCVVIFLSNFLALLIKVDAVGDGNNDALGGLLVAVNVMLVIAVILTSWFSTQQEMDEVKDDENNFSLAMNMVNADRVVVEHATPLHGRNPLSSNVSSTGTASRYSTALADRHKPPTSSRRPERVSVSTVEKIWEHDKAKGSPWH